MRFLPGNAQHIGSRHSQQDSFGFLDPDDQEFIAHAGFLAIVCDGMGGMEYGDAASRTAVRAFLDAYKRKTPEESIPGALERSVHEANQQVLKLAASLGLIEGMGTTLAATAVQEGAMYFVSVGDSGIFHVNENGIRMINRPHIFANVLDAAVARGNMTSEDAANHPERESLTSYIGAQRLEEIDRNVDPFPLEESDVILLASDGLFKTLDLDEMYACCTGHPQSWPEQLVECTIARQREYQDNVTVLSVATESVRTLRLPVTAPPRRVDDATQVPPRMDPPPPAAARWTPPVPAAPPRSTRSRTVWLGPIIVLLLLAAGAAAWWWYEHRPGLRSTKDPALGVEAPHRDPLPPPPPSDPKDVQPPGKEAK